MKASTKGMWGNCLDVQYMGLWHNAIREWRMEKGWKMTLCVVEFGMRVM
jgi:hypothetical protein